MGMPITTYNVLNALDEGRFKSQYEFDTAIEALKPFKLFAFVIHDPEVHKSFHWEIQAIFHKLDSVTRDDFLFFALVDPPEAWLRYGSQRSYYKSLNSRPAQEFVDPNNAINSTDKGIAAFLLARNLDIPTDMLPCLVITSDFLSKDLAWVRTSPNRIEWQLTQLAHITSQIGRSQFSLERIKKSIDVCEGSSIRSLENRSVAKALADPMSASALHDQNHNYLSTTVERARNHLTGLRTALVELKQELRKDYESGIEEFDKLCQEIALFCASLNRPALNLKNFIDIEEGFLEHDSYVMLRTAHRLEFFMNTQTGSTTQDLRALFSFEQGESFDYTPGAICLAKIFEREINLSLVHWIREKLGIDLPDYFDQYQPETTAIYKQGRILIDFNKSSSLDDKWIPPGIGQSQIAFKAKADEIQRWLSEFGYMKSTEVNFIPNLLQQWDTIKTIRNNAAHAELVNETSVNEIKAALKVLSNAGIFKLISEIKEIAKSTAFFARWIHLIQSDSYQPVRFVTYTGSTELSKIKIRNGKVTGVDHDNNEQNLEKQNILFACSSAVWSKVKLSIETVDIVKKEGIKKLPSSREKWLNVDDKLLQSARDEQVTVLPVTRCGHLLEGTIEDFDEEAIYMQIKEHSVIVYRHGLYTFAIEEWHQGVVDEFYKNKGFGFIKSEKHSPRIFVHRADVRDLTIGNLQRNQKVKFYLNHTVRGTRLSAINVELIEE